MKKSHIVFTVLLSLLAALAPAQGQSLVSKGVQPGFRINGKAKMRRNMTILLTGDSLMESLGPELKQALAGYEGLTVIPIGKKSTGLSRPDFYNWPQVLEQHLQQYSPTVVVMWVGTNDPQNIHGMTGLGEPCSKAWQRAYLGKLKQIIALTYKYKARLVFMGPPVMDTEPLNSQLFAINRLMEWISAKVGAHFINTRAILSDKEGRYIHRAEINGKLQDLRTHDHVHITSTGNQIIMQHLLPAITAACTGGKPKEPQPAKKGNGSVRLRYP